jgi:site-specific recombinase XerD
MINLYRRHRQDCEAGLPLESTSGEFEERKKGWKKCACTIHASGTLEGKFKRRATGLTDWEQTKTLVAQWTSWDPVAPKPKPGPDAPTSSPDRVTIEKAVHAYRAELEDSHAESTIRAYRYQLEDFLKYSRQLGYVYIDQWQAFDVRAFRASWGVKLSTSAKRMSTLKAFFAYCQSNRWIKDKPTTLIKEKRTRKERESENGPRIPFSDQELATMFTLSERAYGMRRVSRWERPSRRGIIPPDVAHIEDHRYRWGGQDLADFIAISTYTGLRISDVVTFNARRLSAKGECVIRTTKYGNDVATWIPDWLQARIRAREKTEGPFIFGFKPGDDIESLTDLWRKRLHLLWSLAPQWEARPTPHRFRHTFARILLQKGVPISDVAELLGNTEAIVRKHYAAWVPERQARLTQVLQDAFTDKPQPHVIAFPQAR